jgi:hypothetical protein
MGRFGAEVLLPDSMGSPRANFRAIGARKKNSPRINELQGSLTVAGEY